MVMLPPDLCAKKLRRIMSATQSDATRPARAGGASAAGARRLA